MSAYPFGVDNDGCTIYTDGVDVWNSGEPFDRAAAFWLAETRGWDPDKWDIGFPEVNHPLDFLTEDEVESIIPEAR